MLLITAFEVEALREVLWGKWVAKVMTQQTTAQCVIYRKVSDIVPG